MKRTLPMLLAALIAIPLITACKRGATTAPSPTFGTNRVAITVTDRGFEPARVEVSHGQAVTLVVTRRTHMACAAEMVMPDHGIRRALPVDEPVEITCTPDMPGEIHYSCGMGMMRGTIVAR